MDDPLDQVARQLRQHIDQFVTLSDEEWNGLVPHLSIIHLSKHQLMATQGVVANQIGFVLEGVFRQFYAKDGEERTTYFFFDQQLIGAYMSCVTARPSPVSIEALTQATCLVFPYPVLKALFSQYAGWQEFGRLFAEYVMVALEERMAGLLMLSPEERYLALLEGDQRHILQRVPQHYIATYLGITPVSMSRIRNRIVSK
ncbi:Crp/Fnr family transcriptional regulator [Nostoc sp. CHAB 5834]|nr:Crp/Fnr family transcriptional regulator [Nostoc sp. CHAB 5834]